MSFLVSLYSHPYAVGEPKATLDDDAVQTQYNMKKLKRSTLNLLSASPLVKPVQRDENQCINSWKPTQLRFSLLRGSLRVLSLG